ncbi:hypothetical protein [Streptomyces rimosus]|uniref:hypothetical protein n=1 Tax=Streptomyces rimosus TaxID=1927 RepID=UPI0004C7D0E2|nr:hypothetical protein [Streptomyces rimosus]
MARIQVLELPMVDHGDDGMETPFVLIIDQADDGLSERIARWSEDITKRIGARQVLCFPGSISIPANEVRVS